MNLRIPFDPTFAHRALQLWDGQRPTIAPPRRGPFREGRWAEEETAKLVEWWPANVPVWLIAERLGRRVYGVQCKAAALGLNRTRKA